MNARELSVQVIDSQSMLWALVTFIVCSLASLDFAATAATRDSICPKLEVALEKPEQDCLRAY